MTVAFRLFAALILAGSAVAGAMAADTLPEARSTPLVIGETLSFDSAVLDETRRINVYLPAGFADANETRLPVLYMPDGGLGEDFLHVAGLLQVSIGNGSMRPFILVGVENTQRRRDLTGPTEDPEDRKIAPQVGGSQRFRDFFRRELKPLIAARYRTTGESAIVGESAAGLFVVETLLLEPDLFDHYLAFDPSLWWNHGALLARAELAAKSWSGGNRSLYLASSNQAQIATLTRRLAELLHDHGAIRVLYRAMPEEQHSTIYHPAALRAFRSVLAPAAAAD